MARPRQRSLSEIGRIQRHSVGITSLNACYLAENYIFAGKDGKDERRRAFCFRKVGKRERKDDYVALYKSFQAASSSGFDQSRASVDSLARAV